MVAAKDFTGTRPATAARSSPAICSRRFRAARPMARAFVRTRWRAAPVAVLARPEMRGRGRGAGRALHRRRKSARCGLARMAAAFFGAQPDIVAAVTGTKGKSSIVAFLREIWTALGKPAASLGTVGVVGPNGEIAAHAHHARSGGNSCTCWRELKRGWRRASGHRGLQPRPGSIPAGRRDDVGAAASPTSPATIWIITPTFERLPRGQAAAVHRSGGGGRRRRGQCRCRTCRPISSRPPEARGLTLLTVGETGETIKLVSRAEHAATPRRWRIAHERQALIMSSLPLAGEFPGLECAGGGGAGHRSGRGCRTKCSRRWRI